MQITSAVEIPYSLFVSIGLFSKVYNLEQSVKYRTYSGVISDIWYFDFVKCHLTLFFYKGNNFGYRAQCC